ncbi:sarcalumenin [Gemella haemolysans]|nr:sarcalumenin [Gemella haemolysans]
MKIMKKNKIMIYSILSCIIAIIIFLTISYFGKEEPVQKKDSSQSEKKQEQVEQTKDNKHDEDNNQSTEVKKEENSEKNDAESNNDKKEVIQNKEKTIIRNSGNESQKNAKIQDYNGKKLSDSEGVGTTGKVFNSQKEALDFGKQEVKKLTEGDKKPRQFSISKVTAKDGSLVGWTVDIFEDNSVEKIVSNPTEDTEKNKDKE